MPREIKIEDNNRIDLVLYNILADDKFISILSLKIIPRFLFANSIYKLSGGSSNDYFFIWSSPTQVRSLPSTSILSTTETPY